ncbi:MAG TPA: class I SAM-dependent methyltransferase [Pyrinomonadaceae bacterium]|nr:class I SAM-dependent methyltransferase [Pyrinomonadaceae bacterium]
MKSTTTDSVLLEQLAYYRAGAREYDNANRWLLSANRGADWEETYRRGYADAVAAIEALATDADVLELAGGTGMYTELLVRLAAQLTVVDGSPESLEINRAMIGSGRTNVEYVLADIFNWHPPRRYDVIVFAFWLCHVPLNRFEGFWRMIEKALAEGGTVVFIDARSDLTASDAAPLEDIPDIFVEERLDDEVSVRQLSDGSHFRIVRVLWHRSALQALLETLGWSVQTHDQSPWLIGSARRAV